MVIIVRYPKNLNIEDQTIEVTTDELKNNNWIFGRSDKQIENSLNLNPKFP